MSGVEDKPQNSPAPFETRSSQQTLRGKETIEYREALEIMDQLSLVVRRVGEDILNYKERIEDTQPFHGHETSTIDRFARSRVEHYLGEYLCDLEGVRYYELFPYDRTLIPEKNQEKRTRRYYLIIDEIDGTTNTKRALASGLGYRPQAAVSIALSLTELLADLQVSALYELHTQETYTSLKIGENFLSYKGALLIRPKEIEIVKGDSQERVLVIGYSNKKRVEKSKIEEALVNNGKFRIYDGCRASSVDIINIIRCQYDAYIDPRALWGEESGAMLQAYDIAAAIPIALGCGLVVSDIHGESWERYGINDSIPLIVARPTIHKKIVEIVNRSLEDKTS